MKPHVQKIVTPAREYQQLPPWLDALAGGVGALLVFFAALWLASKFLP